ncbi:MAG: hypothetical protein Q9208_004392 [Pyrenodesmia sp. 3 TL-2023]
MAYVESHSDDVTDVSFHPASPSILLSGSTDGLVNLYDTAISDEDDALIQVFNHGSSIAHAGFLSEQELYALSSDEIFSIYETGDFKPDGDQKSTHAFGDLRPQLLCEYVVDLNSTVFTAGEDGLIKGWRVPAEADRNISTKNAGNMNKKRKEHCSLEKDERARSKPYQH